MMVSTALRDVCLRFCAPEQHDPACQTLTALAINGICDVRERRNDDGDSRCEECGHAYRPWLTDNPFWNQVIGGEGMTEDPGGYLCPACFMRHAERVNGPIVWRVVPMWRRPDAAKAAPGRRREAPDIGTTRWKK